MKPSPDPPPRIDTVLFDFDGTLADTTELIMRSYRHTMRRHLGDVPPDEVWLAGFGMTLESQIRRFARDGEEEAAMLDTYRTYQSAHHDALISPFEGALEVVRELCRRGVPLAIVTSKHRSAAVEGLHLCGMAEHFPCLVTPEDVAQTKPHPEPVLSAVAQLGADARTTLFLGDSPHDVAAGKAAGTWTAAAAWGPFSRAALEAAAPDWVLEHPAELLPLVGSAAGAPPTG